MKKFFSFFVVVALSGLIFVAESKGAEIIEAEIVDLALVVNAGNGSFPNHSERIIIETKDGQRLFCVGGMDFGQNDFPKSMSNSRTVYIRPEGDLEDDSRDIHLPDYGLYNGVGDLVFHFRNGGEPTILGLSTDPNIVFEVDFNSGEIKSRFLSAITSNGKMEIIGERLFILTQTEPSYIFAYFLGELPVWRFDLDIRLRAPLFRKEVDISGGHSLKAWKNRLFGTNGYRKEPGVTLCEFDTSTGEVLRSKTFDGYKVGTHEMAIVEFCDNQAYAWIGTEGTQSLSEHNAALVVNLNNFDDYKAVYPEIEGGITGPIFGVRKDSWTRLVWVTYASSPGSYVGYDPLTGETKYVVKLPEGFDYTNGGLVVDPVSKLAVGTCFPSFQNPGEDGYMFTIDFSLLDF